MPSYLNRFISNRLLINRQWIGEKQIRNHFHMPENKPCVDFIAHESHCPYVVGEEKETSDIPKAIRQLEYTVESLIEQGYEIIECILLINSLRKFRRLFHVKKSYLYNRNTQRFMIVKPNLRIRVVKKSEVVKKRNKR